MEFMQNQMLQMRAQVCPQEKKDHGLTAFYLKNSN